MPSSPPKLWLRGDNVTAALLNTEIRDRFNGQQWVGAKQTSDLVKTSDTTLANLPGLSFSVVSGDVWIFFAHVFLLSSATPDVKFAVTAPASSTGRYGIAGPGESLGAASTATYGTALSNAIPNSNETNQVIAGYISAGATGTVQIQGAQNTSDAASTTFRQYSFIIALRISSTAGTSPIPTFTTGQVLDDVDFQTWISDALENLRISHSVLDEDVIAQNNTTLQDLPGLSFDVRNGETWAWVSGMYFVTNSAADAAFGATAPVGSVGRYGMIAPANPITGSTGTFGSKVSGSIVSALEQSAQVNGLVIAGGDGKIQLQGSQSNSDAVQTTFRPESWLIAFRLAVP